MARNVLPREPQSDDFFERANPFVNSQSDDIYASIQAAKASEYSKYLATASATQDTDATGAFFTPSPSSSDDGTLYSMQTSTFYASGSPTASEYTATSSLLTASGTGAAYLNPPSISNTNTAASTSLPSNAGLAEGASQTTSAVTSSGHHKNGLSSGELAAAIVLPILAALALFLLAFLFLRRRAQETRDPNGNTTSSFLPGLREKWGSLRSNSSNTSTREMQTTSTAGAPVLTSRENNSYYTGLDTSSHGSGRDAHHSGEYYNRTSEGGTFEIPPPVYTLQPQSKAAPVLPPIQVDHSASTLAPVPTVPTALDPPLPSSRSAVSISSTLYSDAASIHSARAAGMSIGGPNVIRPGLHWSRSGSLGQGGERDPFATPSTRSNEGSPVEGEGSLVAERQGREESGG